MKYFKVQIPEDKIDFIMELFNSFDFLSYEEAPPEKRTYLAEDYMKKIGLLPPDKSEPPVVPKPKDKNTEKDRKNLMDAINSLNAMRESSVAKKAIFRFPKADPQDSLRTAKEFSTYEELKLYLEEYYRVKVDRLSFEPVGNNKQVSMDEYMIYIFITDQKSSEETSILAGFSNNELTKIQWLDNKKKEARKNLLFFKPSI